MQKPGVLATEVFRAVRGRVLKATENRQFPWIEDRLIENMYFKTPAPAPAQETPKTALAASPKLPIPSNQPALYAELDAVGYASATTALGYMHQNGEGVAQDKAEAARLYRKAADLGDTDAMANLGVMYDNGEGVNKDRRKAAELIVSSIKNGAVIEDEWFTYWSQAFRRELQRLLKAEGVYKGRMDGESTGELRDAVAALIAKSKGGG
jgi:hypothetical protein